MKKVILDLNFIIKLLLKVFAFSAILALLLHIIFFTDADHFVNSDFISFYTGAKIVVGGEGKDIYNIETQLSYQEKIKNSYESQLRLYPREYLREVLPFRNLPFVSVFFIPFSFLPGLLSYRLFAVFNVCILLLFLNDFNKSFAKRLNLPALVFISIIFLPVLTTIYRGQLTLIMLFMFYLLYKSLLKKKSVQSGVLTALLIIKIQYMFAFPFIILLVKDIRGFLKGFLIMLCLLAVASLLISKGGLIKYLQFLWLTEQYKYGSRPDEIFTLFNVLRNLLVSDLLALLLNFTAYLLTILFYIQKSLKIALENSLIIIFLTIFILGIHIIDSDLLLLIIPVFLILNRLKYSTSQLIFVTSSILATYFRISPFPYGEGIMLAGLFVFVLSDKNFILPAEVESG